MLITIKKDDLNYYELKMGEYEAEKFDVPLFLTSQAGEGLEIKESDLYNLLDEYFKDNF